MIAIVDDNSPFVAIRPDGSGDVTAKCVLWKGTDNMPAICSPAGNRGVCLRVDVGGQAYLLRHEKTATSCGRKTSASSIASRRRRWSAKCCSLFGEDGKCWVLELLSRRRLAACGRPSWAMGGVALPLPFRTGADGLAGGRRACSVLEKRNRLCFRTRLHKKGRSPYTFTNLIGPPVPPWGRIAGN